MSAVGGSLQAPGPPEGLPEQELEALLDRARLPAHIAIIMDGNGRWASQRGLPRAAGHQAGSRSVRAVIEASADLGIGTLTLYTFSSENWRRPQAEVEALMVLIEQNLRRELAELHEKGVRIRTLGRVHELPPSLIAELQRGVEVTSANQGLNLNLAINYGGRQEIVDAARALALSAAEGRITPDQIDEAIFSRHLYLPDAPDPDLLVRTAGELRISNYLLWQIAYSELWITDVYWPDFRRRQLLEAIVGYQARRRRFGGVQDGL